MKEDSTGNDPDKLRGSETRKHYSRRSLLRGLAVGAGSFATVGIAGKARADSPQDNNSESVDYERKLVTDNPGMEIWQVSVEEDSFLYRMHKKGRKAGKVEYKKLEKKDSSTKSVSAVGYSGSTGQNSLSVSADSYSPLIEKQETYVKELGECDYYDGKSYTHLWGATGIKFETPVSSITKNSLTGALGLYITTGWVGTLAGILAGTILDLYTDRTVSMIANDADVPVTDSKRIDVLVSNRYEPSPSQGYGVTTANGHMRNDPPYTFLP